MIKWMIAAAAATVTITGTCAFAEEKQGYNGPYSVTMEVDPSLPGHTIFRPSDLSKVKGALPVIAYGNGGCMNIGNYSEDFLKEVASYGFVITAPGPVMRGGNLYMPPRGGSMPKQSASDQMLPVLDWVTSENAQTASIYHDKLDAKRIAVMGGSCGGLQAIATAGDPRVATLVVLNSGIIRGGFRPGGAPGGPGAPPAAAPGAGGAPAGRPAMPPMALPGTEADLLEIHTPTLYLIGGPSDIAHAGAEADYKILTKVPLFNANIDTGHSGTWVQPRGGAMGEVAVAWLRWQLQGDAESGKLFQGSACGLCKDARWTVKKKNLP